MSASSNGIGNYTVPSLAVQDNSGKSEFQEGVKCEKAGKFKSAREWYEKSVDKGYVSAFTNLGYLWAKGKGCCKDRIEALALYRIAANKKEPTSAYNLGGWYLHCFRHAENPLEAQQALKAAIQWYSKAVQLQYEGALEKLELSKKLLNDIYNNSSDEKKFQ
jgi:TPR repeat protein